MGPEATHTYIPSQNLPIGQPGYGIHRLADALDPAFAVGEGSVPFGKAGPDLPSVTDGLILSFEIG
jgi:hypothetical protein